MIGHNSDGSLTIRVETPQELAEALDAIHTQVLDHFPDATMAPYVELLDVALDRACTLADEWPGGRA